MYLLDTDMKNGLLNNNKILELQKFKNHIQLVNMGSQVGHFYRISNISKKTFGNKTWSMGTIPPDVSNTGAAINMTTEFKFQYRHD